METNQDASLTPTANLPGTSRPAIRLAAVDIDGTLKCGDDFAPGNREAITRAQQAGVTVVLVSVRQPAAVRSVAQELGLRDSPVIGCVGAVGQDSAGRELWHLRLPLAAARQLAAYADAQAYELCTTINNITYFRQRPGQALGQWTPDRWVVANNLDALTADPTRILVQGPAAAVVDAQFRAVLGSQLTFRLDYTGGVPHALTIVHGQTNKGLGLARLCAQLGIATREVLAIGDSEPDVDMFRLPGVLSVAVGGAPDNVRQAAQYVSPPCADGAVAWALNTFVLS
jgi:Cof subfamily protein (haloacid dehalogenase superfamily)